MGNPIENIDWGELKKQKQTLLTILDYNRLDKEDNDNLNGLVHLIDSVQDYATDVMKLDEKMVMDVNSEE